MHFAPTQVIIVQIDETAARKRAVERTRSVRWKAYSESLYTPARNQTSRREGSGCPAGTADAQLSLL